MDGDDFFELKYIGKGLKLFFEVIFGIFLRSFLNLLNFGLFFFL